MYNVIQSLKTNKQKITYLVLAGMLTVSVVVMVGTAHVAKADGSVGITITYSDDDGDSADIDDAATKTREKTVTATAGTHAGATLQWRYKLLPLVNNGAQECDATTMASGTRSGRVARITSESYNNHTVCFRVSHRSTHGDTTTATVYDYSDNSDTIITGIDRTKPGKPTDIKLTQDSNNDSGVSQTDGITNVIDDLTITGCAEENSTVELLLDGASFSPAKTVAANTSGNSDCTATGVSGFSINIDLAERSRAYVISAEATDEAGNTSSKSDKAESASIIVDTTAPKVKMTHRLTGGIAGEGDDDDKTYLNEDDTITVTMTFTEANGMSEATTARPTVTFYNDETSLGTDTPTSTSNTRTATYTVDGSETVASGNLKYKITNEQAITDKAGNSLGDGDDQEVKTITNTVIDTGTPTVGAISWDSTNEDDTQAAESDQITAKMTFSEKISQKTSNTGIYYRLGNSGNGTRFTFATGRSFTSGQCRETNTTNQYECIYTVKTGDAGEFQVSIDKFADYAGNAGAKADFTGSITVDTSITAPSSVTLKRGIKDRDNDTVPTFVVTVGETSGKVTLYGDSGCSTAISTEETVTDTRTPYTVEVTVNGYENDGSDDGAKTIYATHEDDAGNVSDCSTAYGTYTLDTSAPTVDEVATGYYSDVAATQLISLTDGRGKAAARSSVYTKVVFDEEVRYRPGSSANALPELKYTIGDNEYRYRIVSYASSMSGGRCKPTSADNISDTYICQYNVKSDDTGTFSLTVDTSTEDLLEHTLEDTYTHADTITLDSTAPAKPSGLDLLAEDDSGDSTTDAITNKTSGLTIEGCAETDSTVQLYANGTAITNATDTADDSSYTCTNSGDDGFSIDISLAEGLQRITAKATDDSSNTSAASTALNITVDTSAPTASLTGAPSGTSNVDTLDVTVGGTGVTHYQYAVFSGTVCTSATYTDGDTDGAAIADKITASTPTDDGSIILCVVGRDTAGNWQTKANATTASWTRDGTGPAKPTNVVLDAADDTGLLATDGITNKTTGLTITGCAEANSTVEILEGGNSFSTKVTDVADTTDTACAGATRKFSADISLTGGDNTYSITARATDPYDNDSEESDTLSIEIRSTAPSITAAGLDLATEDDSGTNTSDDITNKKTGLTISGTLSGTPATDDYVQLYDGTTLLAGATDSSFTGVNNSWSTDIALSREGTHTINAKVHDVAGNAGSATSMTIVIDTSGPTVSVTQQITSPTTDLTPDIKIRTSAAGKVSFGGACADTSTNPTLQSVTAGENTVTLPTLENKTYSDCTVMVRDETGNLSAGAKINSFIVDNTPPTMGSAAINNVDRTETKVTLNERVYAPTAPSPSDFQIVIGGVTYADLVTAVSGISKTKAAASQSFILTHSTLPTGSVGVRYVKGTNHIFDQIGNTLETSSAATPISATQFTMVTLHADDDTGSSNSDGLTRFDGDEVTLTISLNTGTFGNGDRVRIFMGSSNTAVVSYTISDSIVGSRYIDANGDTSFDINLPKSRFSAGVNTVSATYAKVGGLEGSKGSAASITYDTIVPAVSVQNPNTNPATQKEVSATDNESGTTSWKYKELTDTIQLCNSTTMATGTTVYTEGDALTFANTADNGSRICFASEDAAGNTGYTVSNTLAGIDGDAPTVSSAIATSTDGRTVRVTLNERVYATTAPALTDFRVVVSGNEYSIVSITGLGTSASNAKNTFVVTLPSFPSGTQMTLKYTQGTNQITDVIGNPLASFTGQAISNMKLISLALNEIDDTGSDVTDGITMFDGNEVTLTVSLNEGSFSNGDIVRIFTGNNLTPAQTYTISNILTAPTYKDATGDVSFTADLPKSIFTEGLNNLSATYTPSGGDESARGGTLAITYDSTGPIISVKNPSTAQAKQKIVSATDAESTETVWEYKQLTGTTACDATAMTDAASYTEDAKTIIFSSEDDNGTRVCFSATDIAGNVSYKTSNTISGIDTSVPAVSGVSITTTSRTTTKVTFNEPVYATANVSPNDFRIVSGQTQYIVTGISGLAKNASSAKTTFTLNHIPVSETATVNLQYTKGSTDIVDIAGNTLESFTEAVANTPFVTLALATEDDTGVSRTDGITAFDGNEATFTVSLASGTFSNGDQVRIFKRGENTAMKNVVIAPAGQNTINANGETAFSVAITKQSFTEGVITLYATYTPAGRLESSNGIDYSFTYDTTAPKVTVTSPDTTIAKKKQVHATDNEDSVTTWVYKVIDQNTVCDATALSTGADDYTEDTALDLTANTVNGKKVCFSSTDVAGNSRYAVSEVLQGIDSVAPTVTTAVIENYERTRTVLTFSEKVYASTGFSPSEFSIRIGDTGYNHRVSAIENMPTTKTAARKTLVLVHPTVSSEIPSQIVYTKGTETIQDNAGNTLEAFTRTIENTSFITLDLADEDDTGKSNKDNYTKLSGSVVTLTVALTNNTVFSNSDVVTIYSGDDRSVVKRVTVSTFPAQDTVNANGASAFDVEVPRSVFNGNGITILSAGYAPFGNTVLNRIGGVLQVTVDTTPPAIEITEANTDPASQKTVSATNNDTTEVVWRYAQIQGGVVCNADAMQSAEEYTKDTKISFTSEDDNGTKVCFAATDLAGNITHKGSANITGIDTKSPTVTAVAVTGENTITVTMSEAVYSSAGPNIDDFVVFVNDTPVLTDSISGLPRTAGGADNQFAIAITGSFRASDTVSLSYIGSSQSKGNELIKDIIGNQLAAFDKISATLPQTPTLTLDPAYDTGDANDDGLTRFGDDSNVGLVVTLNAGVFKDGDRVRIYRDKENRALVSGTVGIRGGEINARGETSLTMMVAKRQFAEGKFTLYATYSAALSREEGLPSASLTITYDTTAPKVAVTNPDTEPAQTKTVSASDDESTKTTMAYKQIAGGTACNATAMADGTEVYTEGADIAFAKESDNGTKVCFSSSDPAGNIAYGVSGELKGIDTAAPVITVTNAADGFRKAKMIKAVDDLNKTTSWTYKQVSANTACDAAQMVNGTKAYTEGAEINFTSESDNGTKVCFSSRNTVGNIGYAASAVLSDIDNTAPVITVNSPDTDSAREKVVSAIDGESGTTTWAYKQVTSSADCKAGSGSAMKLYTEGSNLLFNKESDNGTKVCFSSVDQAGNVTHAESAVLNGIDRTASPITVVNPDADAAQEKVVSATDGDATTTTWMYKQISSGANCEAGQMNSGAQTYAEGNDIVLDDESDNDTKICFSSADVVGNTVYAASRVITSIDTTAPEITVYNPNNDSSTTKVFRAVDGDGDVTIWRYLQVNATDACGAIVDLTQARPYIEGRELSFSKESDNDTKICFFAYDMASNYAYRESALIVGIDTTASEIAVVNPTTDVEREKVVSATDADPELTTMVYKQIAGNARCDAGKMRSGTEAYSEGDDLIFADESDNGTKICFSSTDPVGNTAYKASVVLQGIDATEPIIAVDGPSTGAAQSKSLSAVDNEDGETNWTYKQISGNARCDAGQMTNGTRTYTEGTDITFNSEDDNGTKVCFSSTDGAGNVGYERSAVLKDIDTTASTISVVNPSAAPAREKAISASDEESGRTTWAYKQIAGTAVCDENQMASGTRAYAEGTDITFDSEDDNGTKVCFSSTDSVNNISYQSSELLTGIDRTSVSTITITVVDNSDTTPIGKTVQANDGETETTIWRYKQIAGGAACNAGQMGGGTTTYAEGTNITFIKESDNSTKICFAVADVVGNTVYKASDVLSGIDATAPIININEPDTNQAQSKTMNATDTDTTRTTLMYKQIAGNAACDAGQMSSNTRTYAEGIDITFESEDDNGTKVCFSSTDSAGNIGYKQSAVLRGIDTTASTITVNNPNTRPAREKAVSATDGESEGTSWTYKQIAGDANCDAGQMSNGTRAYAEGTDITFDSEDDNGTKVCFSVRDSVNNVSYQSSEIVAGIDRTSVDIVTIDISPGSGTTVTPGGDPIQYAQSKVVRASDAETETTVWQYKQIAGGAACDAEQMSEDAQSYTENSDIIFAEESDNGTRVCFSITDSVGNTVYKISGTILGIDKTAPTITIANANTKPAQTKTVSATDNESTEGVWMYKQISNRAKCDVNQMRNDSQSYTEGSELSFASETDNKTRVCFSVTDAAGNTAYKVSTTLSGIDATAPANITITNPDASIVSGYKKMSAADDSDEETVWKYQQIVGDVICDAVAMTNAKVYTEGETLSFNSESDNGTKVCFSVADTVGNTSYYASATLINISETASRIVIAVDTWIDPARPSNPDVKRAKAKAVVGTDGNDTPTQWFYKQIAGDAVCSAALRNTEGVISYTEGTSVILDEESDNGTKICFISVDSEGNVFTAVSEVILGIDSTTPTIIIKQTEEWVSARDGETADASWAYKKIDGDDACDATQMTIGTVDYTEGEKIEIDSAADNGSKFCFSVTDTAGNTSYRASETVSSISITTSAWIDPNSSTDPNILWAQAKAVVGTDGNNTKTVWQYKQIAGGAQCDISMVANGMTPYAEGTPIILRNESDNGTKVCFIITNQKGVASVASSEIITGIDSTAPSISVSTLTTDPAQEKVLSAVDTDTTETVWTYKQITKDMACDTTQMERDTQSYTEGTNLSFNKESDNGTKICFSATDGAKNVAHKVSDILTGIDAITPTVSFATLTNVNRTQTKVTITDRVSSFGSLSKNNFSIEVDGTAYPVKKVSRLEQSVTAQETSFTLTHLPIVENVSATLSYSASEGSGIADAVGNTLESFSGYPISDKPFVGLSLDRKDDTGLSTSDGITTFDGEEVTLVATINLGSFSDGDVIRVYKKDEAAVLQSILISGAITGAIDAGGEESFEIVLPKNIFTADMNTTLYTVYTPVDGSNSAGQKGAELTIAYRTTAPEISITKSDVSAAMVVLYATDTNSDDDTVWQHKQIKSDEECNAKALKKGSTYIEGTDISFTDEKDNDTKVCFSSTDAAGNISYKASETINIDLTAPAITVDPLTSKSEKAKVVRARDNDKEDTVWTYRVLKSDVACNAEVMTNNPTRSYREGSGLRFKDERANGHKVCFSSTDKAGNTLYAESMTIRGIDNSAPTITITMEGGAEKVVRAVDTDSAGTTEWKYRVIKTDDSCTAATMGQARSYREGSGLVFRSIRANNHKVCFSAVDKAGNVVYKGSQVMKGISQHSTPPSFNPIPSPTALQGNSS